MIQRRLRGLLRPSPDSVLGRAVLIWLSVSKRGSAFWGRRPALRIPETHFARNPGAAAVLVRHRQYPHIICPGYLFRRPDGLELHSSICANILFLSLFTLASRTPSHEVACVPEKNTASIGYSHTIHGLTRNRKVLCPISARKPEQMIILVLVALLGAPFNRLVFMSHPCELIKPTFVAVIGLTSMLESAGIADQV